MTLNRVPSFLPCQGRGRIAFPAEKRTQRETLLSWEGAASHTRGGEGRGWKEGLKKLKRAFLYLPSWDIEVQSLKCEFKVACLGQEGFPTKYQVRLREPGAASRGTYIG